MVSSTTNPSLSEPFNNDHFESLPHAPCVTLYHRTGRVGCGTYSHDVMTGRLLDWNSVIGTNDNDGQQNNQNRQLADETTATETNSIPPYVAVMNGEDYNSDNVAKLLYYASQYTAGDEYGTVEEGGPLRGVLVLASNTTSSNLSSNSSPEPLAPQGQNTPSAQLSVGSSYEWNVNNMGNGLTNTDMFGLPTAYVYDINTSNYLSSVATEQSASLSSSEGSESDIQAAVYPSILSEFNYYMGPGGETDANGNAMYNSQKCLEWRDTNDKWSPRCAPLGGNSVWSVAGSPLSLEYTGENANANNENGGGENNNNSNRPTILIATNIDSTSMFHDLSPGANTAASNILTVLMAAQLIGSTLNDATLDSLYSRITFAFFQGESYGYIGSRRFMKDVVDGFTCTAGNEGVSSVYKTKDDTTSTIRACLHPLRQDLTFQNLGTVRGMIAVDQVGNLDQTKNMYVQGGEKTDGGAGVATFLSEVMIQLSANDSAGYTAQASSVQDAQDEEDGASPLPPTPLSSLVQLSNSGVGGVVLSGYDDAYIANSMYHSHLDSASKGYQTIDKDAIASAATLVARSAIAAAYQDANDQVDSETAATYALNLLPTAVDSSSDTFTKLYNCLFVDGNCETLINYGSVEQSNDAKRTGSDLGMGVPLEKPPNFYVSIFDSSNGQPFVRVSGKYYGSLIAGEKDEATGETIKNYGEDENDAFLVRPSLLEMSLFGLLNDFLGRGSFFESVEDGVDATTPPNLTTCKSSADCSSVSYCNTDKSALDVPTCAGGLCVCGSRSHYHPAFDEALEAAPNLGTGRFLIENDEGVSAMYTEPYWSSYVGVRVYRDAGDNPGTYTAGIGAAFALVCIFIVWRLKKTMVKEKVY